MVLFDLEKAFEFSEVGDCGWMLSSSSLLQEQNFRVTEQHKNFITNFTLFHNEV